MVKFLESSHTYLNDDGIIIPSVTQLLSWKFGSGYDDVPAEILEAKAKYGTRIHALVEEYCKTGNTTCKNQIEMMNVAAYVSMAKKLPPVVANEQLVCFDNRLAGTLDILYEDGCIGDIKTYACLDSEKLFKATWQINLYLFCKYKEEMVNYQNNHLLYLPKDMKYKHLDIGIEHSYADCLALLEEYEEAHKPTFVL